MQLVTHDSAIQPFDFNGQEVRVVVKENNEPWWVASDLAKVLGYREAADMTRMLDTEDKSTHKVRSSQVTGSIEESSDAHEVGTSQVRRMSIISEAGLYVAIFNSQRPEAKPFRKWVTSEVLPSVRKHGAYMTDEKIEQVLDDPDTIIQLATKLKEERAAKAELERKQAQDAPKVLFADSVATSTTVISIADLAKILCQNGIDTGQKRFFEWLRNNGFLIRREGTDRNMPTQRSMELGLFQVTERAISKPSGDVFLSKTVKVTGKGQQYFVDRFLSGQLVA